MLQDEPESHDPKELNKKVKVKVGTDRGGILGHRRLSETCWMSRVRPPVSRDELSGFYDGTGSYLPELLLAADDMALNWIAPIPRPPTAPASSPSSTSMGMLSSSGFFFNLGILSSPWGIRCYVYFSICASIPAP